MAVRRPQNSVGATAVVADIALNPIVPDEKRDFSTEKPVFMSDVLPKPLGG